jgi:hypothetical protein
MQTVINKKLAFGVVGEFYDNTVKKVDTYVLNSDDNVIGTAFTRVSEGVAEKGGTGTFVGLLALPKQYVNYSSSIGSTNSIPRGTQASIAKTGRIIANVGGTASVGDSVYFDNATGALGVGTAGAGQTQVPNCKVYYFDAEANGLCVLELLN